jgi:hypothetical protein
MLPKAGSAERIILILICIICAGIIALGWVLTPDARGYGTHEQLGFGACGFVAMYGMPCPTCGMTTAFCYGVRFNFVDGFKAQPVGFLIAIIAYIAVVLSLFFAIAGKNPFVIFTKKRIFILAVIVLLILAASWIYKIQTF